MKGKDLKNAKLVTPLLIITVWFSRLDALAGDYIVSREKITEVVNTTSNQATFGARVEGGTGSCSGNDVILFPDFAVNNQEIYKRAYVDAMLA
jgi:hypothetical protein